MNKFIKLAISKYINENHNSCRREVTVYLQSLGYAIEKIEYLDLISAITQARGYIN
jgi:hypothetical protein